MNGHSTWLHMLLRKNTTWPKWISGVVVDEAHMIGLWGHALGDEEAFRPAWGQLWDLQLVLPEKTPILCLSASAPSHILASMKKSLNLQDPIVMKSSVNRANQVYALHPIYGSLKDFRNLRMLISAEATITRDGQIVYLSLDDYIARTPKTVIFMDDTDLLASAHYAVYNFVPLAFRAALLKQGFIRLYHAGMSKGYLEKSYKMFSGQSTCRILFASSAFALVIYYLG